MPAFLKEPWSNKYKKHALRNMGKYGKTILKPLKNCLLWFNQVAVFTVISWNYYPKIFINFDTKRL